MSVIHPPSHPYLSTAPMLALTGVQVSDEKGFVLWGGSVVPSPDVGFDPITPVNLDASKWPWDGMCDVKAANLFCCEVLYCSRFEALRILSIRRNNLPDVLISPVH